MRNTTWKRELAIASAMLAFGLLVLPMAIYVVGQRLIGGYAPGLGPLALAETIWIDFYVGSAVYGSRSRCDSCHRIRTLSVAVARLLLSFLPFCAARMCARALARQGTNRITKPC
jgi:hypothetical protein